jgi:hypothetical protein
VSIRFRYQAYPVSQPIPGLHGSLVRDRPVIPITLIGSGGSLLRQALADTGADDTVFPESYALQIGVDLSAAPLRSGAGIGLNLLSVRFAEITLRIADPHERHEWKAWVGFTPARVRFPLLGQAGFFQFFDAMFYSARKELELTANPHYPGTSWIS